MFAELLADQQAPFGGIPVWEIAVVFASYFLGFFIRGAFGFGSNMPIVLLTTWVLGPHHAILLVLLAVFVAQVHLLPQGLRTADWRVTRPLIAGLMIGAAIGTWLFTETSATGLTLILGLLVGAIVLTDSFHLLERLAKVVDMRAPWVTSGLAFVSGGVGALGGGGAIYFLVIYLKLACATPAALRGTNVVLGAALMAGRMAFVAVAGLISLRLAIETALLLPAVFLGTWTGTRYFRAASPARFYAALQALLLCAAVALVVKAATRMI
jgi:uncharacterized membrane protein YfcA